MPKGKIIESIIQKAVELGAHRIVPLLTERVVTHLDDESAEHKREKWQQVAIEAIKQCGAAWLPEIETPTTIEQFLARRKDLNCHSSARCNPSAAIRATFSGNLKNPTDVRQNPWPFGSARKAISRRKN